MLGAGQARAQHDPGRNAVRQLAQEKYDAAAKTLVTKSGRMNSPIEQSEVHFVRMLSASLQGDGATAFDEAKKAVDGGVPFGRIAAMPEEAGKALRSAPGYAEWAAGHPLVLTHGPMIGAVTDGSARIWLRTNGPRSVEVELKAGDKTLRETVTTKAAGDHTGVAAFTGLTPKQKYEVRILSDGKPAGSGSFTTTGPAEQAGSYTIVFGGGAGYTAENERVWKSIAKQKPDALFLLGDNVYIDDIQSTLTDRYTYHRRQSQPDWRALVAQTPTYAIYDDHDFGLNDCVPGPFIDQPPWKRESWDVFRENWANPSYGGGEKQPGCWFDFETARVRFFFLDCRYYRDLHGGTMLGPVQKAWLKEALAGSEAEFNVILSSVPWSAGVKPGSRDTWDGFPAEREELFSFIEKESINGVVLLSADRHRLDIRKTERPNGYALHDFMSSRLTNVHVHGLTQNAKGSTWIYGYNKTPGFAKMTFDTTKSPATVSCSLFDLDNELLHTTTLSSDQLRHQP
ncbi:alkaline phosphatase [Haloferula helveola]|uniref:Alkaline phosphatase n=1 Tax=Haloferula helveola TaxID=490095 RepID=A0ABM7RCQ8_9BACT|nr:alkaline phosphatase [Haloferula helveola]